MSGPRGPRGWKDFLPLGASGPCLRQLSARRGCDDSRRRRCRRNRHRASRWRCRPDNCCRRRILWRVAVRSVGDCSPSTRLTATARNTIATYAVVIDARCRLVIRTLSQRVGWRRGRSRIRLRQFRLWVTTTGSHSSSWDFATGLRSEEPDHIPSL